MQWIHRIVWGLVALTMIGTAMISAPIYGEHVPVHAAVYLTPILLGLRLCFGVLLCAITVQGIRKQKAEGWLALSAVLLVAIALFQSQLRLFHIKTAFSLLGFAVGLGTISTIFSLFLITVMLVRRFLHTQRIARAVEGGDRAGATDSARADSRTAAQNTWSRDRERISSGT